jgi:uncharacterized protein (TIGR03435 family)
MRYALALFLAVGIGSSAALAQSPQGSSEPRFEVASVKPALSPAELGRLAAQSGGPPPAPRFGTQIQPGGRFTAATTTLKQLIAYGFDVREAPLYVLTVARSDGRLGSRLKPSSPECVEQMEQRRKDRAVPTAKPPLSAEAEREQRERLQSQLKRVMSGDSAATAACGSSMIGSRANGSSTYMSGGLELTALVSRLSSELSAPVLDKTGLSGTFDVSLEYLSERAINGRAPGLDPNSTDALPPPLTGALQQQLGLKLDKQVGPMPVVIIDAAERPSPD